MDNTNDKHEKKPDNNIIDTITPDNTSSAASDTAEDSDKDFDLPDAPEWISRKWQEEHYEEKLQSFNNAYYHYADDYRRLHLLFMHRRQ